MRPLELRRRVAMLLSMTTPTLSPELLTLPAPAIARMLGISTRHLRALDSSGRVPRPIRLGSRVLWSADEIRRWVEAGSPARDRWEATRSRGARPSR